MIKHLSLDVWDTLVETNEEFVCRRTEMLARMFGIDQKEVTALYASAKRLADYACEGNAYTTDQMCLMLARALHFPNAYSAIRQAIERLFKKYPPTIAPEVREAFDLIHEHGVVVSVASNSNFISGKVLHPYLASEVGELKFGLYSDMVGCAKPSDKFFNQMIDKAECKAVDIIHVEDHLCSRKQGAVKSALTSVVVTSGADLLAKVKLIIK